MTQAAGEAQDLLTQVEAEGRAARVSHCEYTLDIDIKKGQATYRGDVALRFPVTGSGDLFLDFRGKTIESLLVNGHPVAEPNWNGYRLIIPGNLLAPITNVRVVYQNEYDHSGDGFHQFIDPEDGAEYLYSNFEPYEAHRLFPCFDQPDIKGNYSLSVTAPTEWQVVANSPEIAQAAQDDGRTRRMFEPTKRFSTYLFALVVGPYAVVRDAHGDVSLGLYCRQSMLKHLDQQEIFEITKQGLTFYGEFFGVPYQFGKYDQIFVPEFNAGAMENVGAVTHNEFMVFRDPPTENQRRRRAEVILHEMAHMWFGDLVTMRWWNDLWLNESFATFMSYLTMERATRFDSGWTDFNTSMKNWAMRQDQLVTTHPIAGQVADTDETFLNFDGITYGKGASVLKQLVAAIGIEGFQAGMQQYFKEYSYGNATLAQFLGALEQGSGHDLKEWSRLWLETPSLNTIGSKWESDGERVTQLSLTQTAPDGYPTLRPHRVDIGLVRDEGGKLAVDVLPATIRDAETDIPEARGLTKPGLVFPNYNDYGYAKVALDADSVAFVRESIDRVDDTLLRQLLWSSLWNMVRDQQLKSTEFLALVREKLPSEARVELVDAVLAQAAGALGRYVPEAKREAEYRAAFQAFRTALRAAPQGDLQIVWARALINAAIVPDDITEIARLADGYDTVPGLTIDQDMRWTIALKFVGHGLTGAQERIDAESKRDPSDRGQRALVRAETSVPDAAVKAAAWEKINGDGYGSLYLTNAAMSGFAWVCQRDLVEPYFERFFEAVPGIFRDRPREFATDYFHGMFPGWVIEDGILERSQRLLSEAGDDSPVLARMLREANDDLERAIKCRRFAE
jgi:aminopeptidase N